jgi:ferric-dicitrate binding protein FerR (iron transport regulator)
MINEQNNLAHWAEDPSNIELINKVSKEHDVELLKHHLDYIEKHSISRSTTENSWATFQTKILEVPVEPQSVEKLRRPLWSYVLISLCLLGGAYYGYKQYQSAKTRDLPKVVKTEMAQMITEYAPDSSKVVIGRRSMLKYYPGRWPDDRKLWLEGEAMFEVAKGSTFEVNTDQGSATVVGTEFNIVATNNEMKVTCYEGKVLVSTLSGNSIIISMGEEISINGSKMNKKAAHNAKSPSWIEGKMNYAATPMSDIIKDLERYFSKEITLSENVRTKQFTGVLPLNDWDKAINILSKSMNLDVINEGDTKIIIQ